MVGILAAWANARIMVNVTQGTMRNIRTELFTHMESLPISYFDTHPHGDIMSVYTNDVDTLTPGAISYISFAYLRSQGIHPLKIDGIQPTTQNVATNKWKIWSYETHVYQGTADRRN